MIDYKLFLMIISAAGLMAAVTATVISVRARRRLSYLKREGKIVSGKGRHLRNVGCVAPGSSFDCGDNSYFLGSGGMANSQSQMANEDEDAPPIAAPSASETMAYGQASSSDPEPARSYESPPSMPAYESVQAEAPDPTPAPSYDPTPSYDPGPSIDPTPSFDPGPSMDGGGSAGSDVC